MESIRYTKIDLIKIARAICTTVGLADSKRLVEAWMLAMGVDITNTYVEMNMAKMLGFARFIGAFSSGMFVLDGENLAWNKPRFLNNADISGLSDGSITIPRE